MARESIHDSITRTIGNTPLIRLRRLGADLPGEVVVKHEGFNPFASVKDRIGVAMIEDAVARGVLRPGMTIVEPTSGNTGIGLAFAAASEGFRCIFTLPDTMTVERRNLLRALGAIVVLTEGARGMRGAIERAEQIVDGSATGPGCRNSSPTPPTPRSTIGPPGRRSGVTPMGG